MITVDVPRLWLLNANQRLHWSAKARRTDLLRTTARLAARHVFDPIGVYINQVHCTVSVAWPDRRRRDVHNVMPTAKACIDGIVDSGLLSDDDDTHLIGPDLRVSEDLCAKGLACSLTFSFEEA